MSPITSIDQSQATVPAVVLPECASNDNNSTHPNRTWSLARFASIKLEPQDLAAIDGEDQRAYRRRVARRDRSAGFANARAAHISRLLWHRHSGPCDTDDCALWLAAALPFMVEAAEVGGRSAYAEGLRWGIKHCPGLCPDHEGLQRIAETITGLLDDRADAVQEANDHGKAYPEWLPPMADLVRTLRPTWAEVTGLKLNGWNSIDRPADDVLKARKTDLQRERRRARGVKPMSERTRTESLKVLAAELGVNLRTVQRWEKAGTTEAEVARCRDVANLTPRIETTYGSFTSATRPAADNDALPIADAA